MNEEELEEMSKEELIGIIKAQRFEIKRLQEELDKTRLSELDKEYTIDSNINSYNKLAKYSDELEDRIDKAREYIEKSWNDKCTIPLEEVGYSTDDRWEIWKILKGSDKECNCYHIEMFGYNTPILIDRELPENIEFVIQERKDYERMEQEKFFTNLNKMFEEREFR